MSNWRGNSIVPYKGFVIVRLSAHVSLLCKGDLYSLIFIFTIFLFNIFHHSPFLIAKNMMIHDSYLTYGRGPYFLLFSSPENNNFSEVMGKTRKRLNQEEQEKQL